MISLTSPRIIMLSSGLTAAVWILTSTSSEAGAGVGISRTSRSVAFLS